MDNKAQQKLPLSAMKHSVENKKASFFRIANWNLERPLKQSKKLDLAINKIKELNPDIIILTETSSMADLRPDYYVSHTEENEEFPNEHEASIWSKWPIKRELHTYDSKETTCALIDAPFGDLIVYATIIAYHNAGVLDGGKYANAPRTYKPWEMHKEDIILQSTDWLKISGEHPNVPMCVAGDFNQVRDNGKGGYGPKIVRDLLTEKLEACGLSCITDENFGDNGKLQPDPKKGYARRNIDHICISKYWKEDLTNTTIGAWDHFTDDGTYMTDHNGVYFDFSKP